MRRQGRHSSIVIMLLGLCVAACEGEPAGGAGPSSAQPPPEVAVVTLERQRAVLQAELPGRTLPYAVSDVRPQVTGILKSRLFVEGSVVEVGQPLYQIDDTLYQAARHRAEAELASARAALVTARLRAERSESLREHNSISQQDFDDAQATRRQAEAEVARQEAEVETARVNLGYTAITAPIAGKIGRSYLTQGALVTANQDEALATIQTLDPIYVDMNQSSTELMALRRAISAGRILDPDTAAVTLILDDGAAYPHEGTLRFSEAVVDASTGTVTLRAEFPNPGGVLLPGMFVRATIIEGVEPNALLVPQRGIGRDDRGNATALVVDAEGIVQSRHLTVTQTVGSHWLVSAGLEAGDRVIVEGLQYARPGHPVRAVPFRDDASVPAPADAGTR